MALSLKRLLNDYDDVPIYGNGSRPRLTNGHERCVQAAPRAWGLANHMMAIA